eukprot:TRINITY_DN2634_c2_g2_i1.p7 TRINITY_DN2634_c2_g2~~TRINITY_DN2634_c2_g2_i1.p7  ORF type:complete len:123 (+),score=4.63 TRINITY_DN2634_c2_g2_i1:490-858(+)
MVQQLGVSQLNYWQICHLLNAIDLQAFFLQLQVIGFFFKKLVAVNQLYEAILTQIQFFQIFFVFLLLVVISMYSRVWLQNEWCENIFFVIDELLYNNGTKFENRFICLTETIYFRVCIQQSQ